MTRKPKIWSRKVHANGHCMLLPCTRESEAWLERINADSPVRLDPKQPRNGKHHCMYWSILGEAAHNTEKYNDSTALHEAILMQLGMCEKRIIVQPNGEWHVTWDRDSTAFSKMDQAAFSEYFEKAMGIIETDLQFDVQALVEQWKKERAV